MRTQYNTNLGSLEAGQGCSGYKNFPGQSTPWTAQSHHKYGCSNGFVEAWKVMSAEERDVYRSDCDHKERALLDAMSNDYPARS